jgi:hypothetical protein
MVWLLEEKNKDWIWRIGFGDTPTTTRLQEWRPEGDSHNRLHEQHIKDVVCLRDGSSVAGQNRRTVAELSKATVPE